MTKSKDFDCRQIIASTELKADIANYYAMKKGVDEITDDKEEDQKSGGNDKPTYSSNFHNLSVSII